VPISDPSSETSCLNDANCCLPPAHTPPMSVPLPMIFRDDFLGAAVDHSRKAASADYKYFRDENKSRSSVGWLGSTASVALSNRANELGARRLDPTPLCCQQRDGSSFLRHDAYASSIGMSKSTSVGSDFVRPDP